MTFNSIIPAVHTNEKASGRKQRKNCRAYMTYTIPKCSITKSFVIEIILQITTMIRKQMKCCTM